MLKPENLHNLVIETYYGNDNATVIDAYLDVLDYNNLSNESIEKVLNSVSFKDVIDHGLIGHLKDQMEARGLETRFNLSVYYFNINGGLTASDLISELAFDKNVTKIENSTLFKEELIKKVLDDGFKIDSFVRLKLKESLAKLSPKLDSSFYPVE